jgi:hypothetical protein
VGTLRDPTPDEVADGWQTLTGQGLSPETLESLLAAIRHWPTGRLATGAERKGHPVIVSWQRVSGSVYVTLR